MTRFKDNEKYQYLFAIITLLLSAALLYSASAWGKLPASGADNQNSEHQEEKEPFWLQCVKIRVGLPIVEQGPDGHMADNGFNEVRLPDGHFLGFTAQSDTFAIEGNNPLDMKGPRRQVLAPGRPGNFDDKGKWINHVERSGDQLVAWVHDETGGNFRYRLKSMSLATSKDNGQTWKDIGQIITGQEGLVAGKITGEGDCTAVNGFDGYYYAYCGRNSSSGESAEIVARAPVTNPSPGKWKKFYEGKWEEPGLRGNSTALQRGVNGGAARWSKNGEIILAGMVRDGISLHFSSEGSNFTSFVTLREPILLMDNGSWQRPNPSELFAYPTLFDSKTGSNQLSDSWILTYMYLQPNEGFDKRYIVFRPVDVSVSDSPVTSQVGVLLARWFNSSLRDRWATTAAAPPLNGSAYKLETKLGYLMTVADPSQPSVELEECVSDGPARVVHQLERKGNCGNNRHLRIAGWAYAESQENTVPLYGCVNSNDRSRFVSNQKNCENTGTLQETLGYALSN